MSPSPELDARGGQRRAWRFGVTLPLCVLALLLHAVPGAAEWLEFDRGAIASGQLWRLLTCHWVHWNLSHLAWDVAALAVLGWICERRGRWAAWLTLSVAAKLIPPAVWLLQPGLTAYRGLSGLDAALFVLLAVVLLRERHGAGWRGWGPPVLALVTFAAKVTYELLTGATVFADGGGTFVPVPLAHAVGGLAGLVIGWIGPDLEIRAAGLRWERYRARVVIA